MFSYALCVVPNVWGIGLKVGWHGHILTVDLEIGPFGLSLYFGGPVYDQEWSE